VDRRVTIVEPKATWPTEFETISTAVRDAVGPLALRIDHIGSTSVPGLPAKDVIDVQLTVAALDRDRLAPALARGLRRARHRERPSPSGRDGP
jgi:GrpB-like predicted nucleotidyltransferase (UPF0157 family)